MQFPGVDSTEVVVRSPLDLDDIRSKLEEYREAIEEMATQASLIVVVDDASAKQAVSMASAVKQLGKKIETARKEAIEEPQGFIKTVNGMAKSFTGALEEIEKGLKRRIADYQYRLELERREAERIAREEAARLQRSLDAEAKEKGVEPVKVVAPVMPKPQTVTRSEDGATAYIRKEWKCAVVDPGAVPREFCSPDDRKLREAVRAGMRDIPGCRIYEEAVAAIR